MTYLVDSNFFIQAHRFYYPLDVFTSFWKEIKNLANKGILVSLDKVQNEIYQNEDDLTEWCKNNLPTNFFRKSDDLISEYTKLVHWVHSGPIEYKASAKTEFLDATKLMLG